MDKKDEERMAKFFAKAFREVVIPELKDIKKDIKNIQKYIKKIKVEIVHINKRLDRIEHRLDNHTVRIEKVETELRLAA